MLHKSAPASDPSLKALGTRAFGTVASQKRTCGWLLAGGGHTGSFTFASTDGGRTWKALNLPHWPNAEGVSFPLPELGYITLGFGGASVLLRTSDRGQSWTQIFPPASCPMSDTISRQPLDRM